MSCHTTVQSEMCLRVEFRVWCTLFGNEMRYVHAANVVVSFT